MITLIFGAGASYGSGRCLPSNPPLGNDLFSNLVELRGAFARLGDQQKRVFLEQGFEAGMATIANDSRQINPLQKELACYLSSFTTQPDNAYTRLFNKIRTVCDKVAIATLNYDLLIEQSLAHHRIAFDYNGSRLGISLMKIHGSSNFLPELGGLVMRGNVMRGGGGFVEGLRVSAVSSATEIRAWCKDSRNSDISPVLAMYEKGKRVVINKRHIEAIQKNYSGTVHKSSHVVIVGTKYVEHDQHVWRPIGESGANILLVDPYPEETLKWAERIGLQGFTVLSKSFDKAVWDIAKYIRHAAYSSGTKSNPMVGTAKDHVSPGQL